MNMKIYKLNRKSWVNFVRDKNIEYPIRRNRTKFTYHFNVICFIWYHDLIWHSQLYTLPFIKINKTFLLLTVCLLFQNCGILIIDLSPWFFIITSKQFKLHFLPLRILLIWRENSKRDCVTPLYTRLLCKLIGTCNFGGLSWTPQQSYVFLKCSKKVKHGITLFCNKTSEECSY